MPCPKPPSPCETATTSFGRSVKTIASVRDPDYRESLRLRHIYIEKNVSPPEKISRAKETILRSRDSPDLGDDAFENIRETIRKFQDKGEEDVKNQIAPIIIPGLYTAPNVKPLRSLHQLWSSSVPIPFDPLILQRHSPYRSQNPISAMDTLKPLSLRLSFQLLAF